MKPMGIGSAARAGPGAIASAPASTTASPAMPLNVRFVFGVIMPPPLCGIRSGSRPVGYAPSGRRGNGRAVAAPPEVPAEVQLAHMRVVQDLTARALEAGPAQLEHERLVGDLKRPSGVLLDHHDGDTAVP